MPVVVGRPNNQAGSAGFIGIGWWCSVVVSFWLPTHVVGVSIKFPYPPVLENCA